MGLEAATAIDKVAQELGVEIDDKKEEKKGPGRPPGSLGPLPNLKTMTKKDLQKELGQRRKKEKELLKRIEELEKKYEAPAIPSELWAAIPTMAYDYLAIRFGPHWKLTEPEAKAIGGAIEAVIDRYLGEVSGKYPEVTVLCITVGAATVPRVLKTRQLRLEAKAKDEKPKNGNNNGPGPKGKRKDNVGKESTPEYP